MNIDFFQSYSFAMENIKIILYIINIYASYDFSNVGT